MLNYNSDLNKINKIVVHDKNTTYFFIYINCSNVWETYEYSITSTISTTSQKVCISHWITFYVYRCFIQSSEGVGLLGVVIKISRNYLPCISFSSDNNLQCFIFLSIFFYASFLLRVCYRSWCVFQSIVLELSLLFGAHVHVFKQYLFNIFMVYISPVSTDQTGQVQKTKIL